MKRLCIIAALLLAAVTLRAQRIDSVAVRAYIKQDGSAIISQLWFANVVSGTEWYIPVREKNGFKVKFLSVTEMVPNPNYGKKDEPYYNPIHYVDEGRDWDTDRGLEEKAGRCGIVSTYDGCELCWGQGSMGDHIWIATIAVEGLVNSLDDYDAFNFMFVNPDLVAPPKAASVTIYNDSEGPAWNEENVKFWAFGFHGDIEWQEDGSIMARTTEPMDPEAKMIVMMRFDKGLLEPTNVRDMDFETLQKKAFEGSDWYSDDNDMSYFWWLIAILIFIYDALHGFRLFLFLAAVFVNLKDRILSMLGFKWERSVVGTSLVNTYFRDVPLDGNLRMANHVLEKGLRVTPSGQFGRLMGAYFLKWILDGYMHVSTTDGKAELLLNDAVPAFVDEHETQLYRICQTAARQNQNNVLESGELKDFAKKNHKLIMDWAKRADSDAVIEMCTKGWVMEKTETVTDSGKKAFCTVASFKHFLEDFTLSKERGAVEVKMWKEYLVYAQLFGIADKVAAQFKKLYPESLPNVNLDYAALSTVSTLSYGFYNSAYQKHESLRLRAEANARAKSHSSSWERSYSGRGGSSSYGGGGGYSGGGRGGGSR